MLKLYFTDAIFFYTHNSLEGIARHSYY